VTAIDVARRRLYGGDFRKQAVHAVRQGVRRHDSLLVASVVAAASEAAQHRL
jgi:hypothetical protein